MSKLLTGVGFVFLAVALTACKDTNAPPESPDAAAELTARTENPAGVPFPADYAKTFTNYVSLDRTGAKDQVMRIFANDVAMKGPGADGELPYGSILVGEVYKAKKDADGKVLSALGRRARGDLAAIIVMQREKGFGKDYPESIRNGEWDYAAYKADGSATGKNLNKCLSCHAPLKDKSFIFSFNHLTKANAPLKSPGAAKDSPQAISLPAGYRETLSNYLSLDRVQNDEQVIELFANDVAMKGPGADGELPYGSLLVAEVYKAKKDASGKVMTDLGRRLRGDAAAIVVMQREKGLAKDIPAELKNGDWGYTAFKPDGTYAKKDFNKCYECHLPLKDKSFVFSFDHLK